jgi:hypothetical protein
MAARLRAESTMSWKSIAKRLHMENGRSVANAVRSSRENENMQLFRPFECDPFEWSKMKTNLITAFVSLTLFCLFGGGCGTAPKAQQTANVPTLQSSFKEPGNINEKTRVKLSLLENLGFRGRHPERNLGAYFINVDKDEVATFRAFFDGNIPRVDLSSDKDGKFENLVTKDGDVMDKVTSKDGEILGFEKAEIRGDEATVEMVQSVGSLGVTLHEYKLKRQGDKWVIASRSVKAIS